MSNLSFTEAVAAIARGQQVEATALTQENWYPKDASTHWWPCLEKYRMKPEPGVIVEHRMKNGNVCCHTSFQMEQHYVVDCHKKNGGTLHRYVEDLEWRRDA